MLSKRFALFTAIGALANTVIVTANSFEVVITTDNIIKTPTGGNIYFHGTSTDPNDCTDGCLTNWPPVESTGAAIQDDSRFSEAVGPSGITQLYFDGRPLYTCNSQIVLDCGTESETWPFARISCDNRLPVVAWTVQITDSADARAALCDGSDHHVLCGADSIVAQYDASTKLSYDESNNWRVTDASGAVLLTANGYKDSYALTTTITDLQLVDLVALNDGLSTPVAGVTSCATTFQDAVVAYTALQAPCEEVGNINQDLPGACATGDDACIDGFERENNACKKIDYVEVQGKSEAQKRSDKHSWFNLMRKAGMKKRSNEADHVFKKRKFRGMKVNTRAYFKQRMEERVDANNQLDAHNRKKKHQMRKEERMPVSIADDSEDFKLAFKTTLRSKFPADRDVGIIVGPEKHKNTIACKADMTGVAEYDEILDSDNCITYDAAIDGDTTDVHVLGSDTSYNIGGIQIGGKYVPVVKQTLANANADSENAETFDMSCWTGDAWEQQHKVEMVADIYVKFTGASDNNFYNFYTDSTCTGSIIEKQSDGKYYLKPQEYTFHRCAGDVGHNFDADLEKNAQGAFTGISGDQTETLVVTSGDDFVWQCAAHPNSMNGIFTGAGWVPGDEVQCTASRGGIVVEVDTIVGSTATGEVDGDKCGVGYGCYTNDADPLVCLAGADFGCEECQIPEANGEVVAAPCLAQKCVAGEGAFIPDSSPAGAKDLASVDYGNGVMGRGGIPFDDDQDPSDCGKDGLDKCSGNDNPQGNPNCVPCPPGYYSLDNDGYCYPQPTCGTQVGGASRLEGASDTSAGSCAACTSGWAAYDADDCVSQPTCGTQVGGASRLTGASAYAAGSCAPCTSGWAADDADDCAAHTTCGDQTDGSSRLTGASATAAGSCAECDDDTWAAEGASDCAAHTTCGDQTDGTSRLTGASATAAGSCAECDDDTWAAEGASDCAAHTTCGTQVGGASRLQDATASSAGSCAACTSGWAADDTSNCAAHTTCGSQVGGATRLQDATASSAGSCADCSAGTWAADDTSHCAAYRTDEDCGAGFIADASHVDTTADRDCLPDADGDGLDDTDDTCLITGCTVQQLTDAYALLTSAGACSGSRRTHTHTSVAGCKTAGCTTSTQIQAIKTAFESQHSQCSTT